MAIFTSIETIDPLTSLVVNHRSHVEPFSRYKLFLSVYESMKHRKSSIEDAEALTNTVWGKLLPEINQASLDRSKIIKNTHLVLDRFDPVAAVHYVAFHPL